MKEIYDINIQRMNNGAHFTFVSNILARAEADTTVNGKAAELVSNFKTAVSAEDEALKISQKSLLTDDIAKADIDRDTLYAGYKKAVEAFLAMPIADMAQAAKVLAQHIKDYKINTAGQLDKETGLLVNFITDLEDKYSTQVAKLGLTAFVTNLKEANERVRTLTLQRTNEKIGITVGALKTARTASDDAYRALAKMVNALALVFGEKDYTSFIDYVNTEITHYKREVLGQKASAPSTSGSSAVDSGSTPSGGGSSSGTGSSSSGGSTSGGSSSSDGDGEVIELE
ncbi:DUF6261 family protein [Prevotella merdae]|uniref:DUF6261 family protein n=1 Tax=Prevotella merdae TaxID=2079531 RepID=UPI0018E4F42C|nr:DUF6261 family protein [Prevotella merdae]